MPWLTPHDQYVALGRADNERQLTYRGLFNVALVPELLRQIRTSGHGGRALGNNRFQEEIAYAQSRRAKPTAGRQDQFSKAWKMLASDHKENGCAGAACGQRD